MPTEITIIELADQFETTVRTKINSAITLLDNEIIDELADEMTADLAIGTVGRGTVSTDLSSDFWILYGCEISGTNPGLRTVSEGAILYQNQVYHVSAGSVTTTGIQVVYWQLKDNGSDVHVTKELEIVNGTSGDGIKDEGDTTIYRYGEWIESNDPSSGLSLSFTSNTAVSYTTDVYNYRYRRIGKTLEINFLVTASITTGATNVTRIFIPLPDGFTKKDPSNPVFKVYGLGRYDKSSSTTANVTMICMDYEDGTEGNKIVMQRSTSDAQLGSQIIMDNAGTLTLRGNISLEIE